MSYIPGPTLEKIIEKAEKLDAENVAWICERSLNVLKYLHYNAVIHGDVKPQNIIIQPESHGVVLVDFGLASVNPQSRTKSKGYTPYFSSPEQSRGETLIPESDFYSLGMTMIYALGGDIATKGIPSQTPEEFSSFIKRLIVRDPISRPNWEKEDLVETLQSIREKSFGRRHSCMKPLPSTER
ncbi:protein kinase [Candidatus Pacearchaeota archaeon]|nr:protein kinase [Candidatus Pacearchaeota archaeon]